MSDSILFTCPDCGVQFRLEGLPEDKEIYAACPDCGCINLYTLSAGGPTFSLVTPEIKRKKAVPVIDEKKAEKIISNQNFEWLKKDLDVLSGIFKRARELGYDTDFRAGVYPDTSIGICICLEIAPGSQDDPWWELVSEWGQDESIPKDLLFAYAKSDEDTPSILRHYDELLYGDNAGRLLLSALSWDEKRQCFKAESISLLGFASGLTMTAAAHYYWTSRKLDDFCPVIID